MQPAHLSSADSKGSHGRLAGYFAAVQSKDPDSVVRQFTREGAVITGTGEHRGPEALRKFYATGVMSAKEFRPEPADQFVSKNGDVAVEIALNMDGVRRHVGDIFTFDADQI